MRNIWPDFIVMMVLLVLVLVLVMVMLVMRTLILPLCSGTSHTYHLP